MKDASSFSKRDRLHPGRRLFYPSPHPPPAIQTHRKMGTNLSGFPERPPSDSVQHSDSHRPAVGAPGDHDGRTEGIVLQVFGLCPGISLPGGMPAVSEQL